MRLRKLAACLGLVAWLWLGCCAPLWAAEYELGYDLGSVQRENGRIYTVINTVSVENRSGRVIRNIELTVPLASNENVHWQEVLGEELSPQPQSISLNEDGSRIAHYLIDELAVGETAELVQRVAVQNYCVSYTISGQSANIDMTKFANYLQPSDEINSDSPEIISFANAAASASAHPYLQARLLFAAVNKHMTYDNSERANRSAAAAFADGWGNCVDYANFYAACLRALGIPARVCGGFVFNTPAQTDSAYLSPSGHINADLLRHNWVEFYIKGVGWLVADPTFSYTAGDAGNQVIDWTRFANIESGNRLIYTCEYLPDNNSVSYSYQGAAPVIGYRSELALYSVISPFADLNGHWAAESVLALYYSTPQLVNGISENYFGVNERLTRAQFAALLNRVLDRVAPLDGEVLPERLFSDLATGHWAYNEIYRAAARNILSGYVDGTVRPNAYITRAEAAVMLNRVIGGNAKAEALTYSDMQEGYAWAREAVANLYRLGIMHGVSADSFAPQQLITRGEGAAIIYRWLQSDAYYEKYLDY